MPKDGPPGAGKNPFLYLSIDIDAYDLLLMESILQAGFRPLIITVEYNQNYPLDLAFVHFDPEFLKTMLRKQEIVINKFHKNDV